MMMRSSGPPYAATFVLGALLAGCGGAAPPAPLAPTFGIVQVISTDSSGNPGNRGSGQPALSATGRFVAFSSGSTNLVSPNTTQLDVFFHDSCVGSTGCSPTTLLASAINGTATEPNLDSSDPSISGDGRFVAFFSTSTNLVTPNATQPQAYIHDTCAGAPAGCVPQTFFALTSTTGGEPNMSTDVPAMSSTGRFVASRSAASNLVAGVTPTNLQEFLHDTCLGVPPVACSAPATIVVSVDNSGNLANAFVDLLSAVTPDGRFVGFSSPATNLVPGVPSGTGELYLRDACTGAANCTPRTTVVSVDSAGNPSAGGGSVPAISDDGRFIVFNSTGSGIVEEIYLRDTCNTSSGPVGGCTPSTSLISVAVNGAEGDQGSINSSHAISANGRFVVFHSFATNLVSPNPPGPQSEVFLRDTCFNTANCTPKTVLISVDSSGKPVGGSDASISADGHFAAFTAFAAPFAGQVVLARTGF